MQTEFPESAAENSDKPVTNSFIERKHHMSFDFNADDIFEMAEQLERNGAKFYREASENVADPQSNKFLIQLSLMEVEHEKTFKAMRAQLNEKEKTATVFDPEHEAGLYLRALADTRVFFQKTIDLKSMKEILKAAIEAEKDSIVFYLGMKEVVPEGLGKNRIDGIIKEEMGHIRLLSKELVALK
jgi:rubrerythrin